MFNISQHLECDCFFTPYYNDGDEFLEILEKGGFLDFTILSGKARKRTESFLKDKGVNIDYGGLSNNYSLVLTCSDLLIPQNIQNKKIVLVQEGMTDPEDWRYHLVRNLNLPRYLANTSMTGLSNEYVSFCVASEGFKELFVNKGAEADKIHVTGIPNFDNVKKYEDNDFPHKHYLLAATSHLRESLKFENRKRFIEKAVSYAEGKTIIFKLHPNENHDRAISEIERYAPGSVIYTEGNTNHMIANCDILLTRYSSVLLIALALDKKVYSDLDETDLKPLTPIQNDGTSALNIARICHEHLN